MLKFYAELLGGAKKKVDKDAVAIVYVEGPIVEGSPESSPFSMGGGVAASTPIRRALDKAAADDTIKAVVLRVNFARRLGHRERDHPRRDQAREGEEAARRLDGRRRRQRRLLRGLRRRHDLRRRARRSPARSAWSAASW